MAYSRRRNSSQQPRLWWVVPRCSLDFDRLISLANSPNAHRKDKATAATDSAKNQDARRLLGDSHENATGHSPNNGDYDTDYRNSDKECSKALNGVPQLGHLDNATDLSHRMHRLRRTEPRQRATRSRGREL